MSKKLTTEEYVNKAKSVHGDRYDYTGVVYTGKANTVRIKCLIHGDFLQIAADHTNGSNCPECAKKLKNTNKRKSVSEMLDRAKEKHGNKYEYHPETYVDTRTKMRITCPTHGDFYQTPSAHCTTGQGCPKCKQGGKYDTESFVQKMKDSGSPYTYDKTSYTKSGDKIVVTCEKHGDFTPIAFQHAYGVGCPKCANVGPSSFEVEIQSLIGDVDISNRSLIAPQELDIVDHSSKVAIEFNGTYWHSLQKRPKGYHRNKRIRTNSVGYRLISISEQDWKDKKAIITRIIKNATGHSEDVRVNARDCKIVNIPGKDARKFLTEHHIQGHARASHNFALIHKSGQIVAVMTFNQIAEGGFDMVRYATSCTVRGGQSKLFKHAAANLNMQWCQSFVDCDYFDGSSYENSGFELVDDSVTSFRIWHRKVGFMSRQQWWKINIPKTLSKLGVDPSVFSKEKTQRQMMDEAGCLITENSGTKKYMWRKGA